MENQEYYFDVSYQRSKDGPVGMIYLPDIGSVMDGCRGMARASTSPSC